MGEPVPKTSLDKRLEWKYQKIDENTFEMTEISSEISQVDDSSQCVESANRREENIDVYVNRIKGYITDWQNILLDDCRYDSKEGNPRRRPIVFYQNITSKSMSSTLLITNRTEQQQDAVWHIIKNVDVELKLAAQGDKYSRSDIKYKSYGIQPIGDRNELLEDIGKLWLIPKVFHYREGLENNSIKDIFHKVKFEVYYISSYKREDIFNGVANHGSYNLSLPISQAPTDQIQSFIESFNKAFPKLNNEKNSSFGNLVKSYIAYILAENIIPIKRNRENTLSKVDVYHGVNYCNMYCGGVCFSLNGDYETTIFMPSHLTDRVSEMIESTHILPQTSLPLSQSVSSSTSVSATTNIETMDSTKSGQSNIETDEIYTTRKIKICTFEGPMPVIICYPKKTTCKQFKDWFIKHSDPSSFGIASDTSAYQSLHHLLKYLRNFSREETVTNSDGNGKETVDDDFDNVNRLFDEYEFCNNETYVPIISISNSNSQVNLQTSPRVFGRPNNRSDLFETTGSELNSSLCNSVECSDDNNDNKKNGITNELDSNNRILSVNSVMLDTIDSVIISNQDGNQDSLHGRRDGSMNELDTTILAGRGNDDTQNDVASAVYEIYPRPIRDLQRDDVIEGQLDYLRNSKIKRS